MENEIHPSSNNSSARFSTLPEPASASLPPQYQPLLALLEGSNDVFYGLDAEWRFVYLNRKAEALWGRKRELLMGKSIWDEFPQAIETQAYQEMHRALAEQRTRHFETYSSFLDSWVEVEVCPTEIGLGVYLHDISERRQAIEALGRLAAIVESSNDAIISKTLESIVTSWNQGAEQVFGYSADEMIGKPITVLIPPDRLEEETNFLQRIAAGKTVQNYDTIRRKKDGSEVFISVTLSPIKDREGRIVGASKIARDISARKQAEARLQRYSERLAIINRLDRTISSNLDLTQVYDTFVQELQSLISLDRTAIVRLNETGDQWQVSRQWTQHEPAFETTEWHPVQGSVIEWLVIHRVPLSEAEIGERGNWPETETLRRVGLRSRGLFPLIIREQIVGVLTVASFQPSAFSDEDQAMLMTVADQLAIAIQNADLYAEVQRQAAELEQRVLLRTAELETANKELEAFSYSVSHDLRSPLRAIDGFSRILMRDYEALLPDEGKRRLHLVRDNAQQMGQLIDDLLAFSRLSRQPLQRQPVALDQLVNQVFVELGNERANRQIELIVDPLPPCQADPALLKQVIINLLSNALKFTRQRAQTRIEVGSREVDGAQVYFVKDNGTGFDMRYADKLFGVFQRLHRAEEYEGTGVGLAIVQRVIHRHGGRVWVEAELDQGATFYFTLREGD